MIDEQLLRQGLQKLLKDTESAIRDRLSDELALESKLRESHTAAVRGERIEGTASGYTEFVNEAVTQAAAHWLLGCVFVRFLEDNGWLDERSAKVAWIAGPEGRLAIAKDRRTLFLRPDPNLTDRDYLLKTFAEVSKLSGLAGVFDPKHNPLYSLQPTAQGAARIVEFFQKVDPDTNELLHDFSDPTHNTRFLGDLYQNLSESARKRYALCQTPAFVIDFILDRTLTPALDAFGLSIVRMIDPACGSGHFLLASFFRLFRCWQNKEPGINPAALVQRALDAVHGVDLNPFAVEISKFRLLIAALVSSRINLLRDAPDFRLNVAAGDSLLHGSRLSGGGIERDLFKDRLQYFYDTEDAEELKRILGQVYHVVVGNPPYINVQNPCLRDAYRSRFGTCHRQYQLTAPFIERFFDLCLAELNQAQSAGWIGLIASNAFMKRTFGIKLVDPFLRRRDLTHVIDTSGAYLPGHGTPTVILFARNRPPVASVIRAVRGVRGETAEPKDPSSAPVWREIVEHTDDPGFQGKHVSVSDAPRDEFSTHPWSMGGGGAAELKLSIEESAERKLGDLAEDFGRTTHTGDDDAFYFSASGSKTHGLASWCRPLVMGEDVRDWQIAASNVILFPYDQNGRNRQDFVFPVTKLYWLNRTKLKKRRDFGQFIEDRGIRWQNHSMFFPRRFLAPRVLAFGNIATHNHFALAPGGLVFNSHAPTIILSSEARDDQYLALLGLLNSSTACFWLKQVFTPRGGDHVGTEGARVTKNQWEERYDFDTTKLKQFPVPNEQPIAIAKLIQANVDERSTLLPEKLCTGQVPTRSQLDTGRQEAMAYFAKMIALQEELDWHCYRLYGILDEDLTCELDRVPPLHLGERAFEIMLARSESEQLWFKRHNSAPIKELPAYWPDFYRSLVERRIATIQTKSEIALIERPEYKRRWNLPTWEEMESAALRSWLLDQIEANSVWKNHTLVSCAQLRDVLAKDPAWLSVAELCHNNPIQDLDQFVTELVLPEAVPYLPIFRYTESGLRKRREWADVWKQQREEDGGEDVEISIPQKYLPKDFTRPVYWRLRGGLDVSKERFILYPGLQRDSDQTPMLGWAGWDHLEQARALATYYQRMRNEEGWEPERLKPILAGLLDLRAWLKQWHDDVEPETGLRLGTYFSEFAEMQCQELGFPPEEVLAWQPNTDMTISRNRKSRAR
jgi:hypothetical protein